MTIILVAAMIAMVLAAARGMTPAGFSDGGYW
jgi:hypothetical protein